MKNRSIAKSRDDLSDFNKGIATFSDHLMANNSELLLGRTL